MKRICLIFLLFACSKNISAQNLTYKDLKGTWYMTDTSDGHMSWQFIDSVNMVLDYHWHNASTINKATYKTDIQNKLHRILVLTEDRNKKKIYSYYLIKMVDKDTMKLQIDFLQGPPVWTDNETPTNTATYVRRQ
jgi:hypothetical protein